MLQMLLDQNGSFKRASGELALGITIGILWRRAFLFLDANEHFGKEKALELLPRLSVFAHSNGTVKP